MTNVLFVCGGTGGHIFPAMAIAESLLKVQKVNVSFAGRRDSMEERLVSPVYSFFHIRAVPLVRKSIVKNLLLPIKLISSILDALKVVKKTNPGFIIATGGYVSLPIILAGGLKRIPVYIQEQNAVAGLANKIGSRFAKKIYVTSPEAEKLFPSGQAHNLGNPVRSIDGVKDLPRPSEIPLDKKVVLVLGGSQGALGINRKIEEILPKVKSDAEMILIWQAGKGNYAEIVARCGESKNVLIKAFLDDIYSWMNAADVIVSRAGASTIAEILALEKPSILLPFPWATANHQEHNARVLEKAGAAFVELDSDPNGLWAKINSLLENEDQLRMMTKSAASLSVKDAATQIAKDILKMEKML
jgi:UDP-N-acetylglucosamine--N-acetylmuramyl-(pentapeptide) pyrophosphoryl-undecaprenol N-acetylglucosamine transferase